MRAFLKTLGSILGGLLILLVILGAILFVRGRSAAHQTHDIQPSIASVAIDSSLIARGEHLSRTMGCRHCHGERLGGAVYVDDAPFRLTAPNLTAGAGGIGSRYTTIDWVRALRHGVDPAGEPLLAMPSPSYHELSDRDLTALVAYLQQLPPVDTTLPPTRIKPLGYLLIGAGQIDPAAGVVPSTQHPDPVPVTESLEYGAYLYGAACKHCHGSSLEGGPHPDPNGVPVPSLHRPDGWSYNAFRRAVAQGQGSEGALDDRWMPWSAFQHLRDDEVRALHRYVQTNLSDAPSSNEAAKTGR